MNNRRWPIVTAMVGAVLIVLSLAWSYIVPTQAFWSEEDHRVYADAAERAHQASHRVERAETGRSEQEKADARAEFQAATEQLDIEQKRFDSAESRMAWMPRILLVAGIAAIVAGVALFSR
jgi:hypothetical protein